MKKLMTIIAMAACAAAITGCSATKVEFDKKIEGDKTEISYSIWHNDHWMKTEAERMGGGMTEAGVFNFEAAGTKSSPSEEFNRTMQTYTTAFVQLAQIAAAAYNPSASQAVATAAKSPSATSATPTVVVNTQQATETKETAGTKETATASEANSPTPTQTSNSQSAADCDNCTIKTEDCKDCVDQPPSSDAARTSALAK